MKRFVVTCLLLSAWACAASAEDAGATKPASSDLQIKHRWVFTFVNLANDDATQKTIKMMKRAKQAGYNGIFAVDSKFAKFELQDKSYAAKVRKFRKACADEGMQLMVGVCQMGYCAESLANDPNLAEGMPVRNAAFAVKAGKLAPVDDTVKLVNGSLAEWKGDNPVGWTADGPGSVSFRDEQVKYNGKPTLRQEHAAGKPARVSQRLKVQPWHYYHLSVMAKTEDCTSKDFRVFAVGGDAAKGGYALNWQPPAITPTMDWTRIDATFESGENTSVGIYLGSYSPKSGKIWWSDVQIEPGGFVNVIRRPSLRFGITSQDGKTVYTEGKDFAEVKDPLLGNDPRPGYFTNWHDAPVITIPAGSQLKDGQQVLASYHFATTVGKATQINCCFSEPKVYEHVAKEVQWVKDVVQPDFYMMGYDEIRHCGWDDSCAQRNMTCGQILAENVKQCVEIIRKAAPGAAIATWNDMFDPFHLAKKEGRMYLAKGEGPWWGSWEGLPSNVMILNWRQNNIDSLKFFAERGNPQVLAGYYDKEPKRIVEWLEMASQVQGVCGVMYTTWKQDYSKIGEFINNVKQFEARRAAGGR